MKICHSCRVVNHPGSTHCYHCRAPFTGPDKASGMAVTALVLAVVGICILPLGIVALILGLIEMGNIKRGESSERGWGIVNAAVGISLIPIVAFLAYLVLVVVSNSRPPI